MARDRPPCKAMQREKRKRVLESVEIFDEFGERPGPGGSPLAFCLNIAILIYRSTFLISLR